jgi:hypothetical protein
MGAGEGDERSWTLNGFDVASALKICLPQNFPKICKALGVEMIRDGGSLSASFADESGGRHILITKIKIVDRDKLTKERVGYEPPLLIDCDPTKRPQDTAQKHYGELSGPTIPVTWAQARSLMAQWACSRGQ